MVAFFVWVAVFLTLVPSPAHAIPSPDLIVGSLSSLSQLFALLSAVVGGLGFTGSGLVGWSARGERPPLRGVRLALVLAGGVGLCASLAFNVYQHLAAHDARLARLQATLIRPAHAPGESVLDPKLWELSYDQQLHSPLGISTDQVAKLLREADAGHASDINFIDIREAGETELGTLPHFTTVRWPDLASSGIDLKSKRNILFDQNSNRSSATCQALSKQGISCQFMVGGLEKWIAEGRTVGNSGLRSTDQLRGLPHFRNDRVLLDTPAVRQLVGKADAIVVDTRYPAEFAQGHIAGAYNIPIRWLPTPELKERIAKLPRRPVILACYDRRSCFMSLALGLELARSGFDVRGRYTVPWEYFTPTKEPPYVAAWRVRIGQSAWAATERRLGDALLWSVDHGLSLPLAIVLLALLSRMTVLPFLVKSERDQLKLRSLAPVIAEARERLVGDPKRFARFLKAIHRQHGITPGRNLLALLFLPVLAICVAAINEAAHRTAQEFWWMPNLAKADPWHVLPIGFGAGVAVYLVVSMARTRRQQILVGIGGVVVFTAIAGLLSAAVDLYLVASVAIMLIQRLALGIDVGAWRGRVARAMAARNGIVSLARAPFLENCGNKAARLGMMRAEGLPIPEGLVLTPSFLERFTRAPGPWRERALNRIWRRLGAVPLAVRSSAAAEDGNVHSFAGVFETELHVDRAGLADAIKRVAASFVGTRSESYVAGHQTGHILVQPMVAAEYAGVLFTRAPAAGALAMIEMVRGTADGLVSGQVVPETYMLGRFSGRIDGAVVPPIDLMELFLLGRRLEARFGAPQDIEWAYGGGRFVLLQSRDITRSQLDETDAGPARLEAERARLAALAATNPEANPAFAQNELSELLPRPSPLALDLMAALWASGGGVDLACRMIGLQYAVEEDSPALLVTAFGRLYVNKSEERKRTLRLGWLGATRLERAAHDIEHDYRTRFLPEFNERVRVLEAVDYSRLAVQDLQRLLDDVWRRVTTTTCANVERINIAADFYVERAKAALVDRGLDPSIYLGDLDETPLARALASAQSKKPLDERIDAFLQSYGHRAPLDYELAQPRYSESRRSVAALVAAPSFVRRVDQPTVMALDPRSWENGKLRQVVERARRFQVLKEEAKHEILRELAVLRRILLALDQALDLEHGIFHLRFTEITRLVGGDSINQARNVINRRQAKGELFATMRPLPAELDLHLLETMSLSGSPATSRTADTLSGTSVSGGSPITGRACVVPTQAAERGDPIEEFVDGDIIVSRMIHAAWLPYFSRAGGLVCEVGGWLSHIAILAREYRLPLIVGVAGTDMIATGEMLRIEVDGRILRLGNKGLAVKHATPAVYTPEPEAAVSSRARYATAAR
ncbi:MAG: YidC/Oxa1 family membrane protein insertase [Alphaproteobacteria bacterium]|nr:YidC/Oxa1 family membrane protein insertase [Alphaproteobacteria bacterium]